MATAYRHPELDTPWCATPKWIGAEGYRACKRCELCLDSKARGLASRFVLEMAACGEHGVLVTLTYDDKKAPPEVFDELGRTVIVPAEYRNFLKRFRKELSKQGRKCRYAVAGDYGEQGTQRAHFHLALLGVSFADESLLQKAWPAGHVNVRELTVARAKYVFNYVVRKKRTERADGRPPECVAMSNGIGRAVVPAAVDAVRRHGLVDVPEMFRQHGAKRRMPSFVRDAARDELGIPRAYDAREGVSLYMRPPNDAERIRLKLEAFRRSGGRRPLTTRRREARRRQLLD